MMLKTTIKELFYAALLILLIIIRELFGIVIDICKKIIIFIDKLIDKITNIC